MQILIVADTHIPTRTQQLPPVVWRAAEKADMVIHAGDFDNMATYERFAELSSDLRAVHGNRDERHLTQSLPDTVQFELEGIRFTVSHGHNWGRPRPSRMARQFGRHADVVVYGHLHRPLIHRFEGCTVINPGSPVDPRGSTASYVLLTIENGQFEGVIREA